MSETLNKLLLNSTELAKSLLFKRVTEISARMILVQVKPGQQLNLDEASMYIVLDGHLRVSTPYLMKKEMEEQHDPHTNLSLK